METTQMRRVLLRSNGQSLVFRHKMEIIVSAEGCKLAVDDVTGAVGTGPDIATALSNLADQLWELTNRLQRQFTHLISLDNLAKKRFLFGHINTVASGLVVTAGKKVPALGRVVHVDGKHVFQTQKESYTIAAEVLTKADAMHPGYRFATLITDANGYPKSPVLELGDVIAESIETLWDYFK